MTYTPMFSGKTMLLPGLINRLEFGMRFPNYLLDAWYQAWEKSPIRQLRAFRVH